MIPKKKRQFSLDNIVRELEKGNKLKSVNYNPHKDEVVEGPKTFWNPKDPYGISTANPSQYTETAYPDTLDGSMQAYDAKEAISKIGDKELGDMYGWKPKPEKQVTLREENVGEWEEFKNKMFDNFNVDLAEGGDNLSQSGGSSYLGDGKYLFVTTYQDEDDSLIVESYIGNVNQEPISSNNQIELDINDKNLYEKIYNLTKKVLEKEK